LIDERLKELGEYAEKIQKKEPIKLLDEYLKNIESEIGDSPQESIDLGNNFGEELVELIDKYKKKDISDIQISYHMLSLLVSYIKKSLIEEKAAILNIDRRLYKKEMHFLFKGK
jgi:hypothetical protein